MADIDPRLLQQAIGASRDGIVITDARMPDNPILFVNPAFEEMTGFPAEEAVGTNCRFLQGGDRDQPEVEVLRRAIEQGEPCRVTLRNYRRDGRLFWNELSISPILDASGEVTHFIGIQKDVTRSVLAEKRLREAQRELEEANRHLDHLAAHDPLTGLQNRRRFEERLAEEWNRARRERRPLSVVLADLDHFKAYNDRFGHRSGDRCLQAVAAAFRETFQRASDTVARYGGEELISVLAGLDERRALALARSLCARVAGLALETDDLEEDGKITISVGVATVVPGGTGSPEETIRRADEALYRAKKEGRGRAVAARDAPA